MFLNQNRFILVRTIGLIQNKSFLCKVIGMDLKNLHQSSRVSTKIAVIQLNCNDDKNENFLTAEKLIKAAHNDGAKMAFLPECFDMICPSKKMTMENAETIDGALIGKYRSLASHLKLWLSLGGLHEKDKQSVDDPRVNNAHLIISDDGEIVSIYRKVHLFNLDIPGTKLIESEFSKPGKAVVAPPSTVCGRIGQGICYDVRFPEFSISLAKAGADILTFPSSFTVPTGKAHWEILLRSRAIETQCYVVAAAQTGKHNEKRSSYEDKPGYALASIDLEHLAKVRQRLPIWSDRRPELYGLIRPATQSKFDDEYDEDFQFGPTAIVKPYQIFAKTTYSIGFLNHRPILPGHILVSPLRSDVKRFNDLKQEEIFDLFDLIQKLQAVIEKVYATASSTIAIQDGKDAGQSIEHLHVHVLPRKSTDFDGKIDSIYAKLEQHDKEDNLFKQRLLREEELLEQCKTLRLNYRHLIASNKNRS
ncbi:Nitrilase and fragile histidine triad fusion protein NitFhit [Sarcoptes scabiei]|nr:Nitrilase and fragile histidine triad fusion protein NitFhit [Sarcoptes scabiei]